MESPNRQAIKMLREQRRRKKRVVAFLCMASIVVVGTVIALRTSGHAMNNMVLDCVLSHDLPHQHSEVCYYTPQQEGAQSVLVCGTADYVVHKHDQDDCYDKNGNLVCMLPEIEEHVHTEECYQEQKVLSCALQENSEGHIHSDSCYGPNYSAEPVCGKQEASDHTHTEDCYDEDGQLVCGFEESEAHTHDEGCYPTVLVCGTDQGDGKHVHSDSCYTMELTAVCGKREVQRHMHTEECYLHTVDQPDQDQVQELAGIGFDIDQVVFADSEELPAEENRVLAQDGMPVLKCGQLQVLEHVHGDNCHKAVATEDGLLSQLGSGNEGVDMPGQRTAVYQGASMRVTAIYDGDDFPENARVNVERVDEGGGLPEKQEQLSALMNSELQLNALLKVTVSGTDGAAELSGPIRLTIEPSKQGKITAAAWYDNNADLEGKGIYVQSGEPELKLLEMTQQENGVFTTEIYSGAIVGITQQAALDDEGGTDQDGTLLNISQSFVYEDEDYTMVFRIDGTAMPKAEVDGPAETQAELEYEPEDVENTESEEDEGTDNASDDDVNFTEPEDDSETESDTAENAEAGPAAQPESSNSAPGAIVTIAGDTLPANVLDDPEHPLGFLVEPASEDSPEFETYSDYVLSDGSESGLPGMKVMSYELYYQGDELDISQCSVKLELTAKPKLLNTAASIANNGNEQAAPVAMAVLTADTVQEEEAEAAEGQVITVQTQATGSIDQVAGEEEQANALMDSCIASSFAGSYSATSLSEDGGTLEMMLYSPTNSIMTMSADGTGEGGETGSDGKKTFTVVAASAHNPKFKIEYYAVLDIVAETGGSNPLTVIDTRNKAENATTGILPINGSDGVSKTTNIYVGADNKILTKPTLTEIYTFDGMAEFLKKPDLRYFSPGKDVEKNYELKQVWVHRDGAGENVWDRYGDYTTKDGCVPTITVDVNKIILTNRVELQGKTNPIDEDEKYLYISDGDTIRMVYEPAGNTHTNAVNFYDYDISNGRVHRAKPPENPDQYVYMTAGKTFSGDSLTIGEFDDGTKGVLTWAAGLSGWDGHLYAYTKEQGINSSGNYSGSGTKLAFGNVNTGTGLGKLTWSKNGSNELNKYNNNGYKGCTFGLVTGLNGDKIQYGSNINAPNLFNEGSATGKTAYDKGQYQLEFSGAGDTYTLTAVNGTGATELDTFRNPKNSQGNYDGNHGKDAIWTNNFWPMDSADSFGTGTHDVKFGGTATFKGGEHEIRFGPITQKGTDYTFPESDDGLYHNSYFGMNFTVNFELTENYVGPLQYIFFGDDDMWVFLDGKLVCDIGGVHSSVGEIVDLWNYIKKGTAGTHKLTFFYTERGASGSTCWMQFTLPSVTSYEDDPDYGSLIFHKDVHTDIFDGYEITERASGVTDDEFLFKIKLTKLTDDGDEKPIMSSYKYEKYEDGEDENPDVGVIDGSSTTTQEDGKAIYDGAYFTLKKGQYIKISYLPVGTNFTIEEVGVLAEQPELDKSKSEWTYVLKESDQYKVEYEVENETGKLKVVSKSYTGSIDEKGAEVTVEFDNIYKSYVLPKTGGSGTWSFAGAGALLVLAAGCLLARKRMK